MEPSPVTRAVVLTVLFLPAAVIGAFAGALIGAILGAAGDSGGGWAALGWGLLGAVIGIAAGAGLLGWVWATVCGRRRILPTLGLFLLAGAGSIGALVLISRVPGSDEDALRIAGSIVIGVAALSLTYLIGMRTPPRAIASRGRPPAGWSPPPPGPAQTSPGWPPPPGWGQSPAGGPPSAPRRLPE